jgi:hypothetical protein
MARSTDRAEELGASETEYAVAYRKGCLSIASCRVDPDYCVG